MNRMRMLGGTLVLAMLAGHVTAQDQAGAAKPTRERFVSRFSPPAQQIEMLTEELTLDAYQQQQLMPILEENQRKFQEIAKEMEPSPEMEQARRQNRLAYLEARKNGDKALEKQLRDEQIELTKKLAEQILPKQAELETLQDQFQQNISAVLRPDQKTKFEDLWEGSFGSNALSGRMGPRLLRNPQMLLRQVQRLRDLTPAQKAQVDTLFKTYKEAAKPAGDDKKNEMAMRRERDSKLYDDVMAVLTDAQKKQIEDAMKEHMKSLRSRHSEMRKEMKPINGDGEKPKMDEAKPEESKGQ